MLRDSTDKEQSALETSTTQSIQRRSDRVLVDLPLIVRGVSAADNQAFREETFTLTVSAHGALVMLASKVAMGQRLFLINPASHDEREVKISFIGRDHAGLSQVGVEFLRPAPEFWAIDSPPPNWSI
jgi:hypothetical protein